MKKKDPLVAIGIPLTGPFIYWKTVAALLDLEQPPLYELLVFQGALVDRARNELVRQMLDHPRRPTHLLFLDADIIPMPNTVNELLRHQLPIVSGLYRKRLPPYEPMALIKSAGNLRPIQVGKKAAPLIKVHSVGAGCLLIQREVFRRIPPPWFASRWNGLNQLAEDFAFCELARRHRYSVYVDTRVRPLHVEPVGLGTGPNGQVEFTPLL